MTETKVSDLIGLSELAEVLGVTKNEANALRQRPGFPTPVIKFKMGPAWDQAQVLEYVGRAAEQRAQIACAWCGGNGFVEAEQNGWTSCQGRVTCGDCRRVSEIDIVLDEHDHFYNGLSLKVVKFEGTEF